MKDKIIRVKEELRHEIQEFEFRKEKFKIVYNFMVCQETHEEYTTTKLDELNINQVYNLYREKYNIPFPDEIKSLRLKYGISALKMSRLLGFGDNQYRKYEDGEIPSVSNGRMIASLFDISCFKRILEFSEGLFTNDEYKKIKKIIHEEEYTPNRNIIYQYLYGETINTRNSLNGYISAIPEKIREIVLFITSKLNGVFETKLNKLLFYADFVSYKRFGIGITGLRYNAIQYGPVPINYSTIYDSIESVQKEIINIGKNFSGNKFFGEHLSTYIYISEQEKNILEEILNYFQDFNANAISNYSHNELAWIENVENKNIIDYKYGFFIRDFENNIE